MKALKSWVHRVTTTTGIACKKGTGFQGQDVCNVQILQFAILRISRSRWPYLHKSSDGLRRSQKTSKASHWVYTKRHATGTWHIIWTDITFRSSLYFYLHKGYTRHSIYFHVCRLLWFILLVWLDFDVNDGWRFLQPDIYSLEIQNVDISSSFGSTKVKYPLKVAWTESTNTPISYPLTKPLLRVMFLQGDVNDTHHSIYVLKSISVLQMSPIVWH